MKLRRPDNIVWAWPRTCFMFGWAKQVYHVNACAYTLCLGPLTLRWHAR